MSFRVIPQIRCCQRYTAQSYTLLSFGVTHASLRGMSPREVSATAMRRATVADVARVAGVAAKTVSRVLNEENSVAPATAARVNNAIEQLNFRRNLASIALRRGRTDTIGLVVDSLDDPFFAAVAAAVEQAAGLSSLVITASSHAEPQRQREVVRRLLEHRIDGLILAPTGDETDLVDEIQRGLSVVCIDREALGLQTDAVRSDNRGGAAAGVSHLFRAGARRVAFVGDVRSGNNQAQRLEGYRDAHLAAGRTVDETIVIADATGTQGARYATARLLRSASRLDAVFAANNRAVVGVLRAVRDAGEHDAPKVMTFGDLELAELMHPIFDSIAQDANAIGQTAYRLLERRMSEPERRPELVQIPTTLVRR